MFLEKLPKILERIKGRCRAETAVKLSFRQVETCVLEPCGRTSKVGTNNSTEKEKSTDTTRGVFRLSNKQ